jgi:hypothetical protein
MGTTSASCNQRASGGGQVQQTNTAIGSDQIVYQAIDVTATMNNTSTQPVTVTVTATPSSTSETSSSTAGAQITAGKQPWAIGGAIGACMLAIAAL